MAYNDGRVVRGWFHLNKPLHPATHVVRGATLSGKGYVYRVSGGLFFFSVAHDDYIDACVGTYRTIPLGCLYLHEPEC